MDNSLRVVVAAAGTGRRMGGRISKQYLLLDDRPILAHCIEVLQNSPVVEKIVVVADQRELDYCRTEIVEKHRRQKVQAVIAGGRERQDSVYLGLKALGPDTKWVAVHDGARPFLTPQLLYDLYEAAIAYGAAVPGIMPKDTMKEIDQEGLVVRTLERSALAAVQTPQIFDFHKLLQAYEGAWRDNYYGTDDASLFEKYAGRVKVIEGDINNIKITHPQDLVWARAFIKADKTNF